MQNSSPPILPKITFSSIIELTILQKDLSRLEKQIQEFKDEKSNIFEKYHLKIDDIVKTSIDIHKIDNLVKSNKENITQVSHLQIPANNQ